MLSRPPSSPAIAILNPSPSRPTRLATGTRQFSNSTMAVGCDLPAELLFVGAEAQAGRALLDHEAGNALRTALPGPRHHHVDVGHAAAGDESLGAVEHVVVAVAPGARRETGGIRARARLGEAVAREALHAAERRQKTPAQRIGAEGIDHPGRHVVDRYIGRGRGAALRQFLKDDGGIEPRQAGAAHVLAHIEAAEAERRRLAQRFGGKSLVLVPSRARTASSRRARSARGRLERRVVLR